MESCDELRAALEYPDGVADVRDEAKKAGDTSFV